MAANKAERSNTGIDHPKRIRQWSGALYGDLKMNKNGSQLYDQSVTVGPNMLQDYTQELEVDFSDMESRKLSLLFLTVCSRWRHTDGGHSIRPRSPCCNFSGNRWSISPSPKINYLLLPLLMAIVPNEPYLFQLPSGLEFCTILPKLFWIHFWQIRRGNGWTLQCTPACNRQLCWGAEESLRVRGEGGGEGHPRK